MFDFRLSLARRFANALDRLAREVDTEEQGGAHALRGDALTAFGVRITLDTCVFHTPIVGPRAKVLMTDSGKCSYYAPGELDVKVVFGSVADCVASAVAGRVCREESPWEAS